MNLRKFANGRPCQIRIPGVCCYEPETTVLAHIRQAGITGGAQKAPDLLAAWACHLCHAVVDGHVETVYSHTELELMHLQGVMRTQNELVRQGRVHW